MKGLDEPSIDFKITYFECIEQTKKKVDRNNLKMLGNKIIRQDLIFDTLCRSSRAGFYKPMQLSASDRALISRLYELRLQDGNGRGRWIYDAIRSSSKFCPYCEFGEVCEVDHFLSQTQFPEFNINPRNLVPICHACNYIKLSKGPDVTGTYFLNPYYDSLPGDMVWLKAKIEAKNGGPSLVFCVDAQAVGGQAGLNLTFHFRELDLYDRMAARATQVLIDMEFDINELLAPKGAKYIQRHFADEAAKTFLRHGNTLEFAVYQAASENMDYCSGAYRS